MPAVVLINRQIVGTKKTTAEANQERTKTVVHRTKAVPVKV